MEVKIDSRKYFGPGMIQREDLDRSQNRKVKSRIQQIAQI